MNSRQQNKILSEQQFKQALLEGFYRELIAVDEDTLFLATKNSWDDRAGFKVKLYDAFTKSPNEETKKQYLLYYRSVRYAHHLTYQDNLHIEDDFYKDYLREKVKEAIKTPNIQSILSPDLFEAIRGFEESLCSERDDDDIKTTIPNEELKENLQHAWINADAIARISTNNHPACTEETSTETTAYISTNILAPILLGVVGLAICSTGFGLLIGAPLMLWATLTIIGTGACLSLGSTYLGWHTACSFFNQERPIHHCLPESDHERHNHLDA